MSVFNKNRDKVNRFESFVKTYERYMFAIARRILHDEQLAEDACQETVIKLWQRFDSLSLRMRKRNEDLSACLRSTPASIY